MRVSRYILLVVSLIAGVSRPGNAQAPDDPLYVYEAYTENGVLPGARAAAMGGAQIAAGIDGSTLWYNPALLTRIRLTELSGTLTHQIMTNETSIMAGMRQKSDVGNTRLGSLWWIFPVPTYRGAMTLGISLNRVKSFDRIFRYSSGQDWLDNPNTVDGWGGGEDETGNLWALSLGGAVEVSPKASVGVSLDIFDGSDNWTYFFDSTSAAGGYSYSYEHNIDDNYTGITGKIGLTYDVNNLINLSGVIGFPSSITIDQSGAAYESDNQGFYDESHGSASYRYSLPFWFGAGTAIRYRGFILTGEIAYADYNQLEYRSGLDNMMQMNRLVKENYADVVTVRAGTEYNIQPAGIKLRGGYYQEPIGFTFRPIETEPHFYTAGIGFVLDKSVNIDLAYLTGSWERDDPSIGTSEKYSVNRIMATVSYRL